MAKRVGLGVGVLFLATTLWSWTFNAATAGRLQPPAGLRSVQTGGFRTRYVEWGSAGSAVVLVHGAFESADTWAATAGVLARSHRVYALDLVGFGYTERTGHYTLDDQVRQLLALLDALGLDRPILVGHSSGAAIVAEATLRAPDRIGALLLLDGDALATGAGARSSGPSPLVDPYRTTLLRLALYNRWLIPAVYARQCGPSCPPLTRAGLNTWRRPFEVAGAESALWAMVRQGVPGLPVPRLEQLRGLPVPKAVVFGADDEVFTVDSPTETAARIGAPPPQVIAGGRHLTLISHPQVVATAIDELGARAHVQY
jgi:pimeloyl-ACP methyl ester carboxylesterase